MAKHDSTTTLKEIAGTNRGLGNLTVADLKVLIKGGTLVKPVPAAKPASEFYEQVIVGKREEREARSKGNHEAAAWMREKGLVPQGQAWAAVKAGERGVRKLRALNAADGYTSPAEKKPEAEATESKAKAKKGRQNPVAEQHEKVTEVEIDAEVEALVKGGFTEEEAREILGR